MPEQEIQQEVKTTEEVPVGNLPMEEFKAARKEGKLTVEKPVEPEKKVGAAEEKPKKALSGAAAQKRIDRLTKYSATLEEELAALKAKHSDGKEEAKSAPVGDPEPKVDDFKDYEQYMKAQARWEARQELRKVRDNEAKEVEGARLKEIYKGYNKQVIEAKSKYEDWDEVVNQSTLELPETSIMAIYEMENGADVTYFLAQHPEVVEEIGEMTKIGAIRAVEKISLALADEPEEKLEGTEEKTEEKPAKLQSKAPAPIKPISTGATKSTKALDSMDYQAYKLARKAGRAK